MDISIPTNSEMCNRIFLKQYKYVEPDRQARAFWDDLYDFSKNNDLLEKNFDDRCKDNFHECFWELYLPKTFQVKNIKLKKDLGNKRSAPDFYFETNGEKIWLEAVACGEPTVEENKVPAPNPDGSVSMPDQQIMQRLATSIDYKIKKFERGYTKIINKTDEYYVIAVNGYRAIDVYFDDVPIDKKRSMPYVVKTLFGIGDLQLFYSIRGEFIDSSFEYTEKTRAKAPIAHFSNPGNKDIAGILYSNCCVWQQNDFSLGYDFIFIQNPYAKDVTDIFNFCKKGIWVRKSLENGGFEAVRVGNKE